MMTDDTLTGKGVPATTGGGGGREGVSYHRSSRAVDLRMLLLRLCYASHRTSLDTKTTTAGRHALLITGKLN